MISCPKFLTHYFLRIFKDVVFVLLQSFKWCRYDVHEKFYELHFFVCISVKTCWSFHFTLFVGEIESLQTKPRWKKLSYLLPNVCRSPREYQVRSEANKPQRFSRKSVLERWNECFHFHFITFSSFYVTNRSKLAVELIAHRHHSHNHGQNIWDNLSRGITHYGKSSVSIFKESFLLVFTNFSLWEEDWALGCNSMKLRLFWSFLIS